MSDNQKDRKVYVVGHKNPDTDSICSAIAYAELKKQITGKNYVAKRAGAVSEETRYVLDYFHVEEPALLQNVFQQLKDVDIRKIDGFQPGVDQRGLGDDAGKQYSDAAGSE